jgi:hypothetical protein
MKTHFKKLRNPNYIGSWDLYDENGKPREIVVTITKAVKELVYGGDGKQEECSVVYFKEVKPMVANATNLKMIAKVTGSPFIEEWAGKQVRLCVKQVRAFGETHDAIRVKDEKVTADKLPYLTPEHERWPGAKEAIKAKSVTIAQIKQSFNLTPENEALLCS